MTDSKPIPVTVLAEVLQAAVTTHLEAGYRVRDLRAELKTARTHLRDAAAALKTATASLFTSLGRKPRKAKAKTDLA